MTVGRKLAFDKEEALQAAMEVFWQKGYGGASLSELTDAMKINKPSMYSAFGNKETLFVRAVERYSLAMTASRLSWLKDTELPFKQRIRNFMHEIVKGQCSDESPLGCLICVGLSESASADIPHSVREVLKESHSGLQGEIAALFRDDPESMTLGLSQKADQHARYLTTLLIGCGGMARAGHSTEYLLPVIEQALAFLDG